MTHSAGRREETAKVGIHSATKVAFKDSEQCVVHLPCYEINPYQKLLMQSLRAIGVEAVDGGGGGNFLRSVLRRWRADVVHFHWLHPYTIRPGLLGSVLRSCRFLVELGVLRCAGVRLVWTVHNLENHEGQHTSIERWVCRWACRFFHEVICHSEFASREVQQYFGVPAERIRVVPHPRFPAEFNSDAGLRRRYQIRSGELVFLFFGRLAPYKGVEELVAAFRELHQKNARLVIAGSSACPTFTSDLISACNGDPRIRLDVREIPDAEVGELQQLADVVVFPFKKILTSGSLLLAMGAGNACIAPRVGPILETLADVQACLTYDPDDESGLRKAMEYAISNQSALGDVGLANRLKSEPWTWEYMALSCAAAYGLGQEELNTPAGLGTWS